MLYLIRHAESICNLLRSSTGSLFDELSFNGRQDCLELRNKAKLLKEKLDLKIVSSSAGRALETAVLLFGSDIKIDSDWLETNGGYLQDIHEKYVEFYFKLENNIHRKYPNGESNYRMVAVHELIQDSFVLLNNSGNDSSNITTDMVDSNSNTFNSIKIIFDGDTNHYQKRFFNINGYLVLEA